MSTTTPSGDERAPDEIDLLLPWHAVELLSPEEAERVEAALAREPLRRHHLAAVREEQAETVALNRDLGAPSHAARDALFARIEAEGRRTRPSAGPAQRIVAWFAGLAPGTLAWSAAAAVLVIALQAGLLVGAYRAQAPTGFATASGPEAAPAQGGRFVLVAFAPAATAARIDAVLRDARAVIVDGPRAGGLYRLRLTDEAGAAAAIERLRAASDVVGLLIPETAPPKP